MVLYSFYCTYDALLVAMCCSLQVSLIVAGISVDCQHTGLDLQAQSSVGKIHLAATSSREQPGTGQGPNGAPLAQPLVSLNLVVGRVKVLAQQHTSARTSCS